MDREILFKAKRVDNGEWVEGHYYSQVYHKGTIEEEWYHFIKPIGSESWESARIDESTLCQYTGLTDKNNNKIWENDIVEIVGESGNFVIEWADTEAKWIMYKKADCYSVDFDNYWSSDTEVVGNKFDNPELLEVLS